MFTQNHATTMNDTEYRNDADLADLLRALKDARALIGRSAPRNDGELCSALVGIDPALAELHEQAADAQRDLQERIRANAADS